MCERGMILAVLKGAVGIVEAGMDKGGMDEDDKYDPRMTPEQREKADRTLLGEYGLGQRKVLPEMMPLGPFATHSSGHSLLGAR